MNKATVDSLNEKIKNSIDALNGQERYNAEFARLNELSAATAKVKDNPKATDTASEISVDEIEFNNDTIPEDTKPVDLSITNRNEATGKLDLNYKYQSTKENLETVQSSKTYTLNNDNALSTLTEQERLDQLVQDQTVTKTVEFNGADKKSVAVSDLNKDNFTTGINPANNAKVIINTITPDPNDPRGAIVVYKLESTKDNLGDQKVVSSKNLTTKITGFMTSEEKEEKSNAASNFVGTADPLKQASEFVNNLSDVNISFDPNDNLDHSNETIVVKSIESWDDRTGTLVANFVVQSNKNGEVVTSELKTITINGYMTEEQRLNNLLNKAKNFEFNGDKPQNKTTVDEVKLSELSGYLRGRNDETGEFIDLNSENKVKLIIDEITQRDGQYGAISFKYHFLSTRTDIPNNDIVSKTRTYTLNLFQTDGEREKEESNAKNINDLDINVTKNKLASEYDANEITLSAKDPDFSVIDKEIIGYNDITGEIKLSYKLKNNQTNDESETKEIILSGFKTESQRLNELLDSLSKEDIDFNGTKKDQLPSVAPANNKNNYSYDETKKTDNKANIRINSITPDNQAGENTLNLKLISTKRQSELVSNWQIDNFVTPESNNKNLVIDEFRTEVDQDKIDQDIEKQRLNDLSATLDFPNKDKTIASAALKEKFTSNPNTFDNAKLVIDSITEINNEAGTLKVNYHFESTKDGMNKVISETHSQEFSGFKIPSKELNNINNLDASFNGDNSKLPSYFDNSTSEKTLPGTVEQDPDGIYNRVVKVTEVVNANDKDGNLTIKYVIVSTNKNDPSDTYASNEKEVEVPRFKTEAERLDELSSQVSYPGKEKTSPSEIDLNNITFTNNLEDANVELIPDSITKNDLTNSVTGKYKITSTKEGAEDVFVEKEFTISNFQSEVERLNKLVNSKEATKTVTYNDPSQEQRSVKASEFAAKENLFELISTNISTPELVVNKSKIEINPDDIVIDDEDGTITFKYHLVSTKDEFANADKAVKTSTTEGTLVLSGFSVDLEPRKNELINKINELVDSNNEGNPGLTREQADELINLINSDDTDSVAKFNELKKQADITVIKNDLAKLTHLNPKQRSDADSKINNQDLTAQEAKEIYNSYVEIDAKMEKLGELVDKYNKLISDSNNKKYTSANEETKTQFDNNLNYAKELLKSDKYNGSNEDLALEQVPFNLLDKLIGDVNTINSLDYDYEHLNNNSKFPKELIDNLSYLNDQEKQKYKDAIEPKETYSEGQAIYNYSVIVNNHKKGAIDYIDSLKYLNEAEKQVFKDKVIAANGEDFDLVDKIKNDAYEADLSVKKLIDAAKGDTKLTNDEINQIINNLHNLGVNNPNYNNLANELINYNDFADALERYRKDNVSSDTFLENERLLKEQIAKLAENNSYNQNNISEAAQALQDRLDLLKKDSQSEINLVHSLLDLRETTFKNEIAHDNLVNQNRYQNFAKNVANAKYFKLAIKGKATKEEIEILKAIAKSDASNVIYSALIKKLDAIKVYIPRKVTSFKWWLLVSLTLLTLGFWTFMLGRKKNKDL
ncbi:lipoprotein 17-related variable surface protein [Mycoplasmopsis gallinacea]|uniref:ECM-binding protein homolog n=1 Tax=Mycoplasmopsis gallinacea TaxID=29556 RepID=A0A449A418_9BACT|nr:lipoprotein 17-related variable surface protein [Mycoplasmopsis gallinacea]VEU58987.1 Uncharacterised protein [Mycoplasmopsis gallinacea]